MQNDESQHPLLSQKEAQLINPLQLAYVGDTVWELMVRSSTITHGRRNVKKMHQETVSFVNAHSQAEILEKLLPLLTNEEADMVRHGRNVHSRHPSPKHQDPADYQSATAMETLIGYLYVTGQFDRLNELMGGFIPHDTI